MNNILYYPYINLPNEEWTVRALLYYDNVGAIVPTEYIYEPENYSPLMRVLVQEGLVTPIDPMEAIHDVWSVTECFIGYLERHKAILKRRRAVFDTIRTRGTCYRIHYAKFEHEIFDALGNLGLATRSSDGWYEVEELTAKEMMSFLAYAVGKSIGYQPTTDNIRHLLRPKSYSIARARVGEMEFTENKWYRETILKTLIPCPENIDINRLRTFKEKYRDELIRFRNKVELLISDTTWRDGKDDDSLQLKLEEMKEERDVILRNMRQAKFGNIFLGTCGVVAALPAVVSEGVTLSGVAGFIAAMGNAYQLIRGKEAADFSGMKYLALIDRRLGKSAGNIAQI